MTSILLIGGGGHCLTVLDSLVHSVYSQIGIIDTKEKIGQNILGIPIVGCDDDLERLNSCFEEAFISIGSIENCESRVSIAKRIKKIGYSITSIIHPSSAVSQSVKIAAGTFVGPLATINAQSEIREFCILNTGCVMEHQCCIDSFVHVAPGTVLCGNVTIGKGSHIGAGSVVMQGISIGKNVIIGIGSVVTRDIPDNVVAFGNPCQVVRER